MRYSPIVLAAVLCGAALHAQEEATTLHQLCAAADHIAVVQVLAQTDPDPSVHETLFRPTLQLRGTLPQPFALREPAGACCGRALFGLLPGTRHLLFLVQRHGERHLCGGARGVVVADAATLAHVQELLATTLAGPVLARALQNPDLRVRRDAAIALAALPGIEAMGPQVRSALTTAGRAGLAAARPDTTLPYLLTASTRIADQEILDLAVDAWVSAGRPEVRTMVQALVERFERGAAIASLQRHAGAEEPARLRAIELLARLDGEQARAALFGILRNPCGPRVQLQACRALLDRGVDAASLTDKVPASVLQLARSGSTKAPRLRNIRPEERQ